MAAIAQSNVLFTGLSDLSFDPGKDDLTFSLYSGSRPGLKLVVCNMRGGIATLTGKVTSYYHKQLAQEVVRKFEGVKRIVNQVEVARP